MQDNESLFKIRTATMEDITQLLALENIWPSNARASEEILKSRISIFPQGFFIAEDTTGIIASIISFPYTYQADNLTNFTDWNKVEKKCYEITINQSSSNALYILSGTSKPTHYQSKVFNAGINHVVGLASQLGKSHVVGGCLIPGYAHYIKNKGTIDVNEYVFKKMKGRFIDPLIEKYRRLGFFVPDNRHIIANYFPHTDSLNYSALVVKKL